MHQTTTLSPAGPSSPVPSVLGQPAPVYPTSQSAERLDNGERTSEVEDPPVQMPATATAAGRERDGNGWKDIDEISVWDCALNTMTLLKELRGRRVQEGWTKAFGDTLRQILSAIHCNDDIARDRALKWFLLLPQLITRCRFGPGHARTRKQVIKRLEAWAQHDYRGLLTHWLRDRMRATAAAAARNGPPRRSPSKDELARVERLLAEGEVGAAVKLMLSDGVADHRSEAIAEQMARKHPARKQAVGPNVGAPCAVKVDLTDALRKLHKNTSGGVTGASCGVLRYIGFQYEASEASATLPALNKFATLWANGELPQWYHMVTSTVKLVALIKPKDKVPQTEQSYNTTWWGSVRYAEVVNATAEDELEADERLEEEEPDGRPVGMGDLLRRLIEKAVVRAHADAYREFFWPQQAGLGVRGGAGLIVTAVRELLRRNPSFIVVRLDLKNAYNEMQRKAMLDAVERNPSLRHLYQLLYATMYHRSRVYLGDANTRANFDSAEGGQQGSPPVSAAFCAAIHPALVALDEALTTAGGAARAIMDDVYAVGEPSEVFAAVATFETTIGALGSELTRPKCESASLGVPTSSIRERVGNAGGAGTVAGSVYADDFKVTDGVLCAGVPIGSRQFVKEHLDKLTAKACGCAAIVKAKLGGASLHGLWCSVQQCLASHIDHWLMLTDPADTETMAATHDAAIAEAKSGALPSDAVLDGRHLTADEAKLVRMRFQLPASMKGLGTRNRRRLRHTAFVTTTVQALARFPNGVGQNGDPITGFLPNAAWAESIAKGKRNGEAPFTEFHREADALPPGDLGGQCSRSLRQSWQAMLEEAANPEEGPMAVSEDTMTFAKSGPLTQKTMTVAVELGLASRADDLARKIFTEAAETSRKSRVASAYVHACRVNSAWVRSTPDSEERISNAQFAAAVAMTLGTPPECCLQAAGGRISGKSGGSLDVYGEELTGVPRPGNPWIEQHNAIVDVIAKDMKAAGMSVKSEHHELVGFFTSHLPAVERAAYQRRKYGEHGRGLEDGPMDRVPHDIVLDIQASEGGTSSTTLHADVKTVHRGRAERSGWYDRADRLGMPGEPGSRRAVDLRSDEVPKQYFKHAQKLDHEYGGHRTDGPPGPVARAVTDAEVVGLSFGAHGEACSNVHALIRRVAEAKAENQWRAMGCACEADARAAAMWTLRQSWGMAAFRANGRLLVGSMRLVGGTGAARFADGFGDSVDVGYAHTLATRGHDAPDLSELV